MRYVVECLARDGRPEFVDAVQELAALLRTNGLGQTVAYLKGKGKDSGRHAAVYKALGEWLCGSRSNPRHPERCLPAGDLYEQILALRQNPRGRALYVAATDSARRLSEALKPLATAYASASATGHDATPAGSERLVRSEV